MTAERVAQGSLAEGQQQQVEEPAAEVAREAQVLELAQEPERGQVLAQVLVRVQQSLREQEALAEKRAQRLRVLEARSDHCGEKLVR